MATHIVVVGIVVSCAVAGGGFAVKPAVSTPQVQQAALPSLAVQAPAGALPAAQRQPGVSVAAASTPAPTGQAAPALTKVTVVAGQANDPIRLALGLPDPASISKVEDGVVAARPLTSSRGVSRVPEEAPKPSATPGPSPTPVSSPAPSPTPQKDFKIRTYKVAQGDTLLAIANRFGITPETVLWANDIHSADMLQIDHELKILPISGVLHTVKKGETLGGIAEAYVSDRSKIAEVNYVGNADSLQEGQTLIIPGGMRRTTEITGLPAAPSAQEIASATRYTVKQGDTLLSIADAFGVRVSSIQVANGLLDPDMLRLGLVLSIPGGTQQAAAAPARAPAPAAPNPQPTAKPAPAPAPPPPPVSGDAGDRIAAIAQQYVGYRYVWGGTSPSTGFDCSGFVWYVYKQAGIPIARAPLESQLGSGPRVSRDKLLPGDVVFWENTYKPGLSHSGIYLGGGRFINAETEAVGVQIRSMNDPYWSARFYGASRPW